MRNFELFDPAVDFWAVDPLWAYDKSKDQRQCIGLAISLSSQQVGDIVDGTTAVWRGINMSEDKLRGIECWMACHDVASVRGEFLQLVQAEKRSLGTARVAVALSSDRWKSLSSSMVVRSMSFRYSLVVTTRSFIIDQLQFETELKRKFGTNVFTTMPQHAQFAGD